MQSSNVKAGFHTVNNGGSNILTFSMKSCRGSVVTQEIGPCHRKKKEFYFVDILHSISKHPIAGVTNSFKGTAGLLKGSSTFAPRGEKKCPGSSSRKVILAKW